MKRAKRSCHLCQVGATRYGRNKHGFHLHGVGMVDTKCPISKAEYDALMLELRRIAQTLGAGGEPS